MSIANWQTLIQGERPEGMDDEGGMPEDLTLPPRQYERLEVNGEDFDLRKADDAEAAQEATQEYRQELRNGELAEYEGKSTEPWGGGRSRLYHDELRAKMAVDYHNKEHTLSWEEQSQECKRIIEIRNAQFKAEAKNGR